MKSELVRGMTRKEYSRVWRIANREKERARLRVAYLANRESILARQKQQYYEDLERSRAYGRECAQRYIAKNREKNRERTTRWRRANPGHKTLLVARRRAAKKAAVCDCCAPVSFKFIYLQARSLKMHVDHIQPLAKGGKHCLRNLQLLEPIANLRKGARYAEA